MEIASLVCRSLGRVLGPLPAPPPQAEIIHGPPAFEEDLFRRTICPGDVCFDVGANVGEMAALLAQGAGDSGAVLAFEPVWPMFAQLCRRVQQLTWPAATVLPLPMGLSDSEHEGAIQVPDGIFGMGSMAQPDSWSQAHSGASIQTYSAWFTTLDAFLARTGHAPPDFVKIDVEGAELLVLKGAAGLLSSGCRPLMLLEVFAPWQQAFGYGPWQLLSWLADRGYRFLFSCPAGLVDHLPTPVAPFPAGFEMGYNVVAYVPERHADRVSQLDPLRAGHPGVPVAFPPPPRANLIG
jgi:FkbM family methyltransferase